MQYARRRLLLLLCSMLVLSLMIGGTFTYLLYNTAIKEEKERLAEIAKSQARLIESIARFNAQQRHLPPEETLNTTLNQIVDAHKHYKGFGETGEFTLAKREGDKIVFLLSHRHYDLDKPKPILFASSLAEPMHLALSGKSGIVVGLDYRGVKVLAAYEPVAVLNLGIVAKIDYSEIRQPFFGAGLIGISIAFIFTIIGTIIFVYVSRPVLQYLEAKNAELQQEINDRMSAERDLQRIFNLSPDMIGSGDLKGYFKKINPRFKQLLGYEDDFFCQKPFLEYVHDEDLEETTKALTESATGQQEEQFTIENRYRCMDGTYKWIEWSVLPVATHDIFFAVGRDITNRKIIERKLFDAKELAESANKAKSEFLSSMSHELRTPLNSILGFAQILEMDQEDPLNQEQKEHVSHIIQGGNLLLELINEVLDLSAIESGNAPLSYEVMRVEQLLDQCIKFTKPGTLKKHIALVKDYDSAGNTLIRTDLTRTKQILLNLISNAIKYNIKGGSIIISFCESAENTLRISVADTGSGIPPDKLSDLFKPFNRLGAEMSDIEGTGVGLAICKNLVELMNGKVGVESTLGVGSTFWFELPTNTYQSEKSVTGEAKAMHDLKLVLQKINAKLLYIEDNPQNVRLMKAICGKIQGLTMLTAKSAEEGIVIARSDLPDIIIMDINLPGMSGIEAAQRLQQISETASIPVLGLSAAATKKDIEEGIAAGFKMYLTKPLEIHALIKAVKEYTAFEKQGKETDWVN